MRAPQRAPGPQVAAGLSLRLAQHDELQRAVGIGKDLLDRERRDVRVRGTAGQRDDRGDEPEDEALHCMPLRVLSRGRLSQA